MLLADVVATSAQVASTRSRTAKTAALAALLRAAEADDVGPVTAWLVGQTLQGKLGAGWRTLAGLDVPPAPGAGLSVADVEAAFTELAGSSGTGSTARREALLTELLAAASATEREFLSSLLGGELRQGALEGVMLDAIALAAQVAPDAVRRAAMLTGSLPHTAQLALAAPTPEAAASALGAVGLALGRPVRPMLASPAASLAEAMSELGDDVSVEYKLDGARIQVHLDRAAEAGEAGIVRVWTRTLKDVTSRVPELVEVVRTLPAAAAVLDGETLALTDDGRPRPFQETASRFGARAGELALHPYFFDCLHLDGRDLLDAPLSERLAALEQVAGPYRIPGLLRPTAAAAQDLLAAALGAGHEGVMVKAATSPYAAGRRGRAWQKVKPVHTLDLVVLGAEWGYGRRTGSLSNIHLGARDPGGGEPVMVGKTFKGMTDELLAWQTTTFPALVRSRPSAGVVLLRPELVVEIALDGVQRSPRYPGGVALRFARVVRYRPDKDAAGADTIDAVRGLLPGVG